MVKLNKELTLGVLLVVIVIMVLKPNVLGFLYNNMLGKLIFVAAVIFLSLKHTVAGLLAVVFVAMVASMSGYHGFEGMAVPEDNVEDEDATKDEDNKKKKCEGDACNNDTSSDDKKADELVKEISDKLKQT